MLDKKQLQDQMTAKVSDQLFYTNFYYQMGEKMKNLQEESAKTYAEKVNRDDYTYTAARVKPTRFRIPDDDAFKTKKWDSLFKECGFYFNEPTIGQELKMKQALQLKYDDLFADGWRPPLQNRTVLMQWACESHNTWMTEKGNEAALKSCERTGALIEQYGPDYNGLKAKLGYV